MRLATCCVLALIACTRSSPDRIAPAPERSVPTPTPTPAPDLTLTGVSCQIGGTKPAFFVWAEASASRVVKDLRATKFELATKPSGFASGASSTIDLRRRDGANGQGNVRPLGGTIEPGGVVHLEVFGPLALAPFGPGASYPSEDRAFRVELESSSGRFVFEGTCMVGPAG